MKLNIPNTLSIIRILMIPWFLWEFLNAQTQSDFTTAAVILVVSGLTDTIDGTIARKFNMITQLGKILDPLADKLTLASVITALWIKKPHLWWLCGLLILKELLMLIGGLKLHTSKVTIEGSKWFGKVATVLFYVIMVVIVAVPVLSDHVTFGLLLFLLLFMLFAFLQYVFLFCNLIKKVRRNEKNQ